MSAIVIQGNIATGKSTLSRLLAERLNYELVCMDHIRIEMFRQFGSMNEITRERKAEGILMERLAAPNIVYETTGATLLFNRAFHHLASTQKPAYPFVVLLKCSKIICIDRFHARKRSGHFQVPPPYRKKLTIAECWDRFEYGRSVRAAITLNSESMRPGELLTEVLQAYRKRC